MAVIKHSTARLSDLTFQYLAVSHSGMFLRQCCFGTYSLNLLCYPHACSSCFPFHTDSPCSNMLGMLSGLIPDSQISASSTRGYHWAPSVARLVSSRSGWFPHIPQAQPGEEWLQVDLGVPKNVRGVIIQGARGGDSINMAEARAFVRKFKVSYSINGKDWETIMDPKTMQPKV